MFRSVYGVRVEESELLFIAVKRLWQLFERKHLIGELFIVLELVCCHHDGKHGAGKVAESYIHPDLHAGRKRERQD